MAPYRFTCSSCGERLSTAPSKAGHKVKCPACKQVVLVPIQADVLRPPSAPDAGENDPTLQSFEPVAPPSAEAERVELIYAQEEPSARARSTPTEDGTLRIRRAIVYVQGFLLGLVALVFFVLGVVVGGRSARHDARLVNPQACRVQGSVSFEDSKQARFPDQGCVVCIVPATRRPDQKLSATLFSPDAGTSPTDDVTLRSVRQLGGDYCRADARGAYRLQVPATGRYYLLVVSSHAIRPPTVHPKPRDLAEMGRYFVPATDLVGQYQYRWQPIQLDKDRTLDVDF